MFAVVVDEDTTEGTGDSEVLNGAAGGVDTGVPSAACALDVEGVAAAINGLAVLYIADGVGLGLFQGN